MSCLYSSCLPLLGSVTELADLMRGNRSSNRTSSFIGYCGRKLAIIGTMRSLLWCGMSMGGSGNRSSSGYFFLGCLVCIWSGVVPCCVVRAALAYFWFDFVCMVLGGGGGGQCLAPPELKSVVWCWITENVAKDTFKGSLFDCQENVSHYTYYFLNNQCEY